MDCLENVPEHAYYDNNQGIRNIILNWVYKLTRIKCYLISSNWIQSTATVSTAFNLGSCLLHEVISSRESSKSDIRETDSTNIFR